MKFYYTGIVDDHLVFHFCLSSAKITCQLENVLRVNKDKES